MEVVEADRTHITREITVNTTGDEHAATIVSAVKSLADVEVLDVFDCTFKLHEGGKLDVVSKTPLRDYVDLSMAYTPGVARVCQAIHKNPAAARDYTIRRNTVGIVTDGTRRAWPGQHWRCCRAACDGRQGRSVQGVRAT